MIDVANQGGCPVNHYEINYEQHAAPEGFANPADLRNRMFAWYMQAGSFRGCVFNKVASRQSIEGQFTWVTPIEYAPIEELYSDEGADRIVDNFESIIGDGTQPGLVSYMFPSLDTPLDLCRLIRLLHTKNPDRFMFQVPENDGINDIVEHTSPDGSSVTYAGIGFQIKIGTTELGQDTLARPMVYAPWNFTTYARRFDVPMITFNRENTSRNPETPETFIGVDDINLDLRERQFDSLLHRSLAVRGLAHSLTGEPGDTEAYSRKLFRAHNALVVPYDAWIQSAE